MSVRTGEMKRTCWIQEQTEQSEAQAKQWRADVCHGSHSLGQFISVLCLI